MNQSDTYQKIKQYFSDKPVKKVSVFGSFSRNDDDSTSDIDLIIQPSHPLGLIVLGKYVSDLEQLTQRRIDLATENSITPDFFHIIQKDLRVIYAA
jgi:predicted nucleotidyltransferase